MSDDASIGVPQKLSVDAFSSPTAFMKEGLNRKQKVDYFKLFTNYRIVFLGEFYECRGLKAELLENLDSIYKMGFTHLGLDYFPEDLSKTLEAYDLLLYKGRHELESSLKGRGVSNPDLVMQILNKAKRIGMDVLPLGLSDYKKTELKHIYKQDYETAIRDYEKHVSEVIEGVLTSDKKTRVLSLLRSPMAQKNGVAAYLESKTRVKSLCVRVVGCANANPPFQYQQAIEAAARMQGVSEQRFMVELSRYANAPLFDYVLHLPQKENLEVKCRDKPLAGLIERFVQSFRKESFEEQRSTIA